MRKSCGGIDGRRPVGHRRANVPLPILEVYNFLVSADSEWEEGGDFDYSLPPLSLFFTCLRKFPRRDRGGSHVKRRGKQTRREGEEERRSCDFKSTKFITSAPLLVICSREQHNLRVRIVQYNSRTKTLPFIPPSNDPPARTLMKLNTYIRTGSERLDSFMEFVCTIPPFVLVRSEKSWVK